MQNQNLPISLSTKQLTLTYSETVIIEGIDITIPRQKITVLIGANGSGKSTLLRGLARLLKPYSGIVYLEGVAITRLSSRKLAQRLGVLPQGPKAPEGLTVRELVAQGRYPHQNYFQQWSIEDEAKVEAALVITHLEEFANRSLDTLSGGQRQRAWIAMTLAQDTDILLLDEPTTYLDLAHQIEVLDLLYHLNIQQQKTIIMVLHDINQAGRYGDYLIALRGGKVYAEGQPSQVITESLIENVFGLKCHVMPDPVTGSPLCIPISRARMKLSQIL